ncbi:respiratory nitrate reductase subunit gamma [bacterium]|nr:respiratory nitrate reductase subunit gamma [bacterium]
MTFLHFSVYITTLVFIITVVARAIRIARMPVHLRWELYPVPHEKGRAHYGGSILEEVDWWTKPHHKDHIGEFIVMISEILLLKGVWEHNRRLWFGTFPLHFGLYLLMGNIALLILYGILHIFNIDVAQLLTLIRVITWVGCILGAVGSLIMLYKRFFDSDLKEFSTMSHYFNLIILGAIFISGIIWVVSDEQMVANLAKTYTGLITFSAIPKLQAAGWWHIGLSLFFIFYLPFTHMTHFFTKYFTYHSVRWEDESNLPGDPLQKKLDPQLKQIVTWAAPYVGADGKKNWVDIVTSPVPEIEEKK